MTRIRKPNNELSRTQRLVRAQLRNLCVVYVAGITENEPAIFNISSGNRVYVNVGVKKAFMEWSFEWTVSMTAIGRTQANKNYVKSQVVDFHGKYFDAAKELGKMHAKFVKEAMPVNQILTAGWIASPVCSDIDTDIEERIFTKLGAFTKFISSHEEKSLRRIL